MYIYCKGFKDFVKNELLRYGGKIKTFEQLFESVCKIDNDWYECSMERKGKYDLNYK